MSSNNGLRWSAIRILKEMANLEKQLTNERAENLHISCVNCDNWQHQEEYCMKFRDRPPAKIIAFGCIDWTNINDDVPF